MRPAPGVDALFVEFQIALAGRYSLEERRETPAALPAFVKREGSIISAGGVMVGGCFLIMTTVAAAMTLGPLAATGTIALVAVGLPFGAMIWQARKLMRRGFEPPDVRLAFDDEISSCAMSPSRAAVSSERPGSGRRRSPQPARAGSAAKLTPVCGA